MANWLIELFTHKKQSGPSLLQIIEQAKQDWLGAHEQFRTAPVDHDLVDYSIYMIQATEKRYVYLLRQARLAGAKCSPYFKAGA